MSLLINIIPLVVILALLFKKAAYAFAGLVGGILAVLIGGLEMSKATQMFVGGITKYVGHYSSNNLCCVSCNGFKGWKYRVISRIS